MLTEEEKKRRRAEYDKKRRREKGAQINARARDRLAQMTDEEYEAHRDRVRDRTRKWRASLSTEETKAIKKQN